MTTVLVLQVSCRCTFTNTQAVSRPCFGLFEMMLFAAFWRKSLFLPCIKTCGYNSVSQQATTSPAWLPRDRQALCLQRKQHLCSLKALHVCPSLTRMPLTVTSQSTGPDCSATSDFARVDSRYGFLPVDSVTRRSVRARIVSVESIQKSIQ